MQLSADLGIAEAENKSQAQAAFCDTFSWNAGPLLDG